MSEAAVLVQSVLGRALGQPVRIDRRTPLGGGDISQVERLDTTAGRFVLKSDRHAIAGLFRAEAEGLAALAASGTSLRVPQVVACRNEAPSFLILEDLGHGRCRPDDDERFGRGLAELHRAGADRFGFAQDNFCGATPQPNPWTDRWVDFYGRARLGHQLELADRSGLLSVNERQQVERLIARLDSWLTEPAEGPALIHGDLWSGNRHVSADGTPAVIDPAASYAHREAELGMMTLFGSFSSRVFAAYEEAFPLEAEWRDRNPLYQLYHLMNHLNLFGPGYHGQVMTVVRRFAGSAAW
jgi:fructosamine-3-kinase